MIYLFIPSFKKVSISIYEFDPLSRTLLKGIRLYGKFKTCFSELMKVAVLRFIHLIVAVSVAVAVSVLGVQVGVDVAVSVPMLGPCVAAVTVTACAVAAVAFHVTAVAVAVVGAESMYIHCGGAVRTIHLE